MILQPVVVAATVATGGVWKSLLGKNLHPLESQMDSPSSLAPEVCPCPYSYSYSYSCSCSCSCQDEVLLPAVASFSSSPTAAAAEMPDTEDYSFAASVDSFALGPAVTAERKVAAVTAIVTAAVPGYPAPAADFAVPHFYYYPSSAQPGPLGYYILQFEGTS